MRKLTSSTETDRRVVSFLFREQRLDLLAFRTASNGRSYAVDDGYLQGDIQVKIDLAALVELLGPKALQAETRRTRVGGYIEVIARRVVHIKEARP